MTIGRLQGKRAIRIHREVLKVTQGFTNKNFWTRGYCVSTVGVNEEQIGEYIKNQEDLDKGRQGLLNLDGPEIN
jgi:putative transposase